MNAERWFAEVRARGVVDVGVALGLEQLPAGKARGFGLGPCPACGSVTRHPKRRDNRGALGPTNDRLGFKCHECDDARGDAVDLAALIATGRRRPEDWAPVRRACAAAGLCEADPRDGAAPPVPRRPRPPPPPPPPEFPPADELRELWGSGLRLDQAVASPHPFYASAARYVASRGVNLGDLALLEPDLCRIIRPLRSSEEWWPPRWSRWAWAVQAFDSAGEVRSIHARAIGDDAEPKTRWPNECSASGLLFASRRGVDLLRGSADDLQAVLIAEGLSDFVVWSAENAVKRPRCATLGITSGATIGLRAVRWPAGVIVYSATDNDGPGDEYAAKIRASIPAGVNVLRIDLKEASRNV